MMLFKLHKKCSNKQGISPAISTVIITGAMVAILSVTLVFANNFLWTRVAEGEFNSSKQLMQTIGLQIDDVAWTVGRTETVTYGSQYGDIVFGPSALSYTITVNRSGYSPYSIPVETGALMFNFPTSRYSITNNYFENIYPEQTDSLTLTGTSAPVARVFALERVPLADGSYIRVVVAPTIRVLYSSITQEWATQTNKYIECICRLNLGEFPRYTNQSL